MPRPRNSETNAFAFIHTSAGSSSLKPSGSSRKTIRRHVMRGKNTRKRNATLPNPKPPASDSRAYSWLLETKAIEAALTVPAWGKSQPGGSLAPVIYRVSDTPGLDLPNFKAPPNDLLLTHFAEEIDDTSRMMLFKYFISLKDTMYPPVLTVDFDATHTYFFQWTITDLAYLSVTLFSTSAMGDFFEDRVHQTQMRAIEGIQTSGASSQMAVYYPATTIRLSARTRRHLGRSLALVNERMAHEGTALQDSTIGAVMGLSLIAHAINDEKFLGPHVAGLKRLVRMRGGLRAFDGNWALQIKICLWEHPAVCWSENSAYCCSVEVAWCMRSGEPPELVTPTSPDTDPFAFCLGALHPLHPSHAVESPTHSFIQSLPGSLSAVFRTLQRFSATANFLIQAALRFSPPVFQSIAATTQYRLLLLSYKSQTVEEIFRHALMVYIAMVFVQLPQTRLPDGAVTRALRSGCACLLRKKELDMPRPVALWLLMISSIAVFDPSEPWLVKRLSELAAGRSWGEINEELKSVMWVDILLDGPGRRTFKNMTDSVEL